MKSVAPSSPEKLRFKLMLAKPSAHSAELVVLNGYRGWRMGLAGHDLDALERIWKQFAGTLDESSAALAFSAMADFVHSLDLCSSCPLRGRAIDDERLHPDEALVIGLISSLQNDDTQTAELCLDALTCASRSEEVEAAAALLAAALKSGGQGLLPVHFELQSPADNAINTTVH